MSTEVASAAKVSSMLILYCVCGTLLTLANKLAIEAFHAPNTLLVLQNGMTIGLLLILTKSFPDKFGGKLPGLTMEITKAWLPLVLMFVGMLITSLVLLNFHGTFWHLNLNLRQAALMFVTAVTLIVIRNGL